MQAPVVMLLAVLTLTPHAAHASAPDDRALLRIADSLLIARRGDSALVLLAPAIERARAARDAPLLAGLLTRQGTIRTWLNEAARAEAPLREALRLAEAANDSLAMSRALRWLAAALSTVGRTEESARLCRRLRPLARAIGAREDEAQAVMLMAYHDLLTGDHARAQAGYRESIHMFRGIGATFWELWALTGLGRVYDQRGDFVGARVCLIEILTRSRATDNPFSEAIALNNLGTLEYTAGDPATAVGYWMQALAIDIASGSKVSAVTVMSNLALARVALGHFDAAEALLDSAYALADSLGLEDRRAMVLMQSAGLRLEQGRPAEAAALYRRLRRDPRTPTKILAESATGLAAALARLDSTASVRDLLENELATLGARIPIDVRLDLEIALGRRLLDDGHAREAVQRMRPLIALTNTHGLPVQNFRSRTLGALAFMADGRMDSARAWIDEATRRWEDQRSVPADPEWRERYANLARTTAAASAELALGEVTQATAAERQALARESFDRQQRFKSRTLAERMQGPGAPIRGAGHPSSVIEALQNATLTPDELFIDFVEGTHSVWLIAVSRDSLRVARISGAIEDFRRRVDLVRDLAASPPAFEGEGNDPAAARALSRRMFAGINDLVALHRTLVFCMDGPLHGIPPALLTAPGPGDHPLIESHSVQLVPSAAVFVRMRAATRAAAERAADHGEGAPGQRSGDSTRRGARGPHGILAVLGEERPDGRSLPGARTEVEMLVRRYADVERRGGAGGTGPGAAFFAGDPEVIHVAAHTAIYNQRPWHSGIYLGASSAEGDPYLRAVTIAGLRLPATLAVLSACESAGGERLAGEGVLGLTTAFMSAGVPCVVASLWPVDDAATARLMATFYRHLARGDAAIEALSAAQASVRRQARTRHPFYWAGFVLIGDGQVRVTLERRAASAPLLIGLQLVLAIAVLATLWRRRRNSAVTRGHSGTLTG